MTGGVQGGSPASRLATPAPRLDVVGVDGQDVVVVRAVLGHGDDPQALLAAAGWRIERVLDIVARGTGSGPEGAADHGLTARFRVVGDPDVAASAPAAVPRDEGLLLADGEVPEPSQRVAAYALVTSGRGLLMTEYSDRTAAPGAWGLPGGGLEPGESPQDAVRREVWEETGQRLEVGDLLHVQTSHWIGRSPDGRLEDYHAVRTIFAGTCPQPTDPLVHDVGGTTASAAWVDEHRLARLEVTSGWRAVLARFHGA